MSFQRIQTPHMMIYRMDIERSTKGASPLDVYEGEDVWDDLYTNIRCFFWYDIRRTSGDIQLPERSGHQEFLHFIVPHEIDIQEHRDRIVQVRTRKGDVILNRNLLIVSAMREHSHIRLMVQEQA